MVERPSRVTIPVSKPEIGRTERLYVQRCLEEGWVSSEGPWVEGFEQACADRFGRRHAIAVVNGSAALDTALAALEMDPGAEVIVPTFTIISCAAAVVRCGAVPVFVDADPLTWCLDTTLIEQAITGRTKAIMAVHIYGLPCDMEPILRLAEKYGLTVIEDAAEAHGQSYQGRPCGSFGLVSTLSFYANKHVTTGEGGMVLTDDDGVAQSCRDLRNLCFSPARRFRHDKLGWNFRMGSMQAALGLAQLERLEATIRRKRAIGGRYRERLGNLPVLQMAAEAAAGSENHYWVVGVVVDSSHSLDAEQVISRLAREGIGARPFFWPMHLQPALRDLGFGSRYPCPVSEHLADRGLYLPSGSGLSDGDIDEVCGRLRRILE